VRVPTSDPIDVSLVLDNWALGKVVGRPVDEAPDAQ